MSLRSWRERLPRRQAGPAEPEAERTPEEVWLDRTQLRELDTAFAAPRWLEALGRSSWLLVGVTLLVAGIVWLMAMLQVIVMPVLAGTVVAIVAIPLVHRLQRHRVPRAAGAAVVLLIMIGLVVVVVALVLGGLRSQSDAISQAGSGAAERLQSWLESSGVDQSGASSASENLKSVTPDAIRTFVRGVASGIAGITSLVLGLTFAALTLFFMLKDGPRLRAAVDGHLGIPPSVARLITGKVVTSMRKYFLGVTYVAAFNAVVVGVGALVLGVPLAGTIAIVQFVCAYVPYIGALVAGAFAVMIALGAEGTTTGLIMLVIVILANGLLQNIFQPIAYGATLQLHPLVVLIVTISAGALFGMAGLVLAAPLTSAAVKITADLRRARAKLEAGLEPGEPPPETGPPEAAPG